MEDAARRTNLIIASALILEGPLVPVFRPCLSFFFSFAIRTMMRDFVLGSRAALTLLACLLYAVALVSAQDLITINLPTENQQLASNTEITIQYTVNGAQVGKSSLCVSSATSFNWALGGKLIFSSFYLSI